MTESQNKEKGAEKSGRTELTGRRRLRIRRTAFCGMFTALAVIMGYIESFIAIPGLLPGMKLGLSNCVILFVLMAYGMPWALLVSLVRIIVINSLFGNLTWAVFSLAGAVLSIFVMALLKRTGAFSAVGISIAGGAAHNLGQTIVAMILFQNAGMIYYFPMLILFGLAAGFFVGLVSGRVYRIAGRYSRKIKSL